MKTASNRDPVLMFEQACAFLECAEFTESEKSRIKYRTKSHGYVDIALSAFACELFIKCLIIYLKGDYSRIHNLFDLWSKYKSLDNVRADKVERELKQWFNSSNPDMFTDMIKDASNAFEEWRYVFDHDSSDNIMVNPNFLRGFRIALRNLCCEYIFKESWSDYLNNKNVKDDI